MSYSAKPPVGRKMKARAPAPPSAPQPAPRKVFRNAVPDGGAAMDTKENMARSSVDLQIRLPNAYETTVTVDGRKALMDVLVDLCAQYRLNPAEHTLELTTAEGQAVSFKPNTVVGTLQVSRALVKERTVEERVPRRPAPKAPEKTVRLVVNYHRGQKAVLRVNPLLPLHSLVSAICQKCEFNPARVLLLRDAISQHELDLSKSLTQLDIRELYVLDQTLVLQPKTLSAPVLYCSDSHNSDSPGAGGGEKKGLFGLFNFNRRKSKTEEGAGDADRRSGTLMQNTHTNTNGVSVVSGVCVEARPNTLGQSQSVMNLSRLSPKTEPKKRRAPAPPPATPTALATPHTSLPTLVVQTKAVSPSQLKKKKAAPPPPAVQHIVHPIVHPTTSSPALTGLAPTPVRGVAAASDDSMSDLSHSIEDSEPPVSVCGSSSSDDDAESSSVAEETMPRPAAETAAGSTAALNPVPRATRNPAKREPEETESALGLKMEDVEDSRHSAMAWLHAAEQEAETVSMCSSESLADQGYAASEGMADSPSTSPEDTASLGPDPSLSPTQPQEDCDSDEGCTTWGSHYSGGNVRSGARSVERKCAYEEDTEIATQIQLTLADLDADLAHEVNRLDDDIPVSVVDLDVPVTAIDEVIDEHLTTSSWRCNRDERDGPNKNLVDLQNRNNNARVSASITPFRADPSPDKKEPTEKVTRSPEIKVERSVIPAHDIPESRLQPASSSKEVAPSSVSFRAQNMISQNPVSRFGLKTFTIVPTKPSHSHAKSEGSLRIGAIKIDELGNMVTPRQPEDVSEDGVDDRDSPLVDKAKAFWTSGKKEESGTAAYKRASAKNSEDENTKAFAATGPSQKPTEKPAVAEAPKQSANLASAVMKKLAVSDPAENMFFSEHRRNLTFLKPSRRTSSHYVASAINRCAWNSSGAQELPESPYAGHKQSKNDLPAPVRAESNRSAAANVAPPYPAANPYLRSPTAEKRDVSEELRIPTTNRSNALPEYRKPHPQAKAPACSESTNDFMLAKKSAGNASNPNSVAYASRPAVAKKPELHSLGLQPSPFGPVKKFKPVVPKSVEKETSLHSSLMEAIQSGEGIERLRKISESSRNLKKLSYVEPESERSALLSAIRAESNSARLKKTRSSAAVELEHIRKSEESRVKPQTRPELPQPPTFTPPPPPPPAFVPPPPPTFAPPPPPPPPPTSTLSKSSTQPAVVLPAGGNPESARAALLEAIRSGAGAERLRKVPASTKTLKVNGRLGIIQASAAPPQEL